MTTTDPDESLAADKSVADDNTPNVREPPASPYTALDRAGAAEPPKPTKSLVTDAIVFDDGTSRVEEPPVPGNMTSGRGVSGESISSELQLVASGHPQAIGKLLSKTNDILRMVAAGVAFLCALGVLLWLLCWVAAGKLLMVEEMASLAATHRMPELLGYYLVGKGVVLSAFVGASLALLRVADRLSRPLFLSEQSGVSHDDGVGPSDTVLAAIKQVASVFRQK